MLNLKRLDLFSTHLAEALTSGAYRSVFKGQGMEFEEVRPYTPGDDVRTIDWNVTARLQIPYIKRYQEERQLPLMLLIDLSTSTLMRGPTQSKREKFAETAALLSFAALKNRDRVGAIFFSDTIQKVIPSSNDSRQVERIVHSILHPSSNSSQSNLSPALHLLNHMHKRKTISFILSDHSIPLPKNELSRTAQHHDLVFINVFSPFESHSFDTGLTKLQDLGHNTSEWIDTSHPQRKQALENSWQVRRRQLTETLYLLKTAQLELSTEEQAHLALYRFFMSRKRKVS